MMLIYLFASNEIGEIFTMKKQILVCLLCLAVVLTSCGKNEKIIAAEKAISEIGEVSLESIDLVLHAQELCDQLSEKDLEKVSNFQNLVFAKEQIAQLYEQQYQECYNTTVDKMLDTLAKAETVCNLTLSVWHDSIWKVENKETEAYTKNEKGVYFDDFNDALDKLNNSDEYKNMIADIQKSDMEIKELVEFIKNPPDRFKGNMLDAFVNYYTTYQSFIQLTLNYNESYSSFSDKFIRADEDSIDAYRKATFYTSSH